MPRRTTAPLLRELLSRPALNGGWDKLARQQDEQCREQKCMRRRVRRVEKSVVRVGARVKAWDHRWRTLVKLLSAIAVAVVAKVAVEVLQFFHVVGH